LREDQHDWIAASDLIITIPGTNTAEVAVIGTPMISVFPIEPFQMIPLEGVYELFGKIPVLGFIFKKIYVKIAQDRIRFFAIPNIKAGKEIVPDLRGRIQPINIAEKAISLLHDRNSLEKMSKELKLSLGGTGASLRIAEEIIYAALH
jgi:lipid-A-disaccharide synthase